MAGRGVVVGEGSSLQRDAKMAAGGAFLQSTGKYPIEFQPMESRKVVAMPTTQGGPQKQDQQKVNSLN